MSFTREVTIWCDVCQDWFQRTGLNVRAVRKELHGVGWRCHRRSGVLVDVCPYCVELQKSREEASAEEGSA